jgi:calmodulin
LPAARVETEISLGLSLSLFQNGDGFISAKELGVLMRTLGRNPTEDEIMHIMNEIDVDHNGKLDFSEFTVMMRDKLTSEDMELEIKQAFRYVITIRILTHSL